MAILEVTLEQEVAEMVAINRFTYVGTGTPAAVSMSFGLVSAMGAIPDTGQYPVSGLMRILSELQSNTIGFVSISVKNLYSFTDFYQTPFVVSLIGLQTGDALPPTNAWGFRTNRTRLDIRRGFKRFAGVSEAGQSEGIVAGAFLLLADAVAAAMSEVLEYDDEGNTLTYTPVILGRDAQPNPNDETLMIYPYFPTEAEQLEHVMSSIIWEPYTTIRTQTTRQYGRGI